MVFVLSLSKANNNIKKWDDKWHMIYFSGL